MQEILQWTFLSEENTPAEIQELLIDGEHAYKSFKTIRDTATFTNKRLIVIDSQGLTGRKKEIYSLPYSSILMWSTENEGTFDLDSEISLWTRAGYIKISLRRGLDARSFERLFAEAVL